MSFGRIVSQNITNYGFSLALMPLPNSGLILIEASRTQRTAYRLVEQIRRFGDFSQKRVLRLTTDKFAAYSRVLAEVFFAIPYRYLPIVKRRVKMKLTTVKKVLVAGTPRSLSFKYPKNSKYLVYRAFQLDFKTTWMLFTAENLGIW